MCFQKNGSDYIKNNRLKLLILGMLFFGLMSISGIYATTVQLSVAQLYSGGVDIELKTYKLNDENAEVEINDDYVVYPSDVVSVIPKIKNNGDSCYIRAKFFYINNDIDVTEYITGISDEWRKIDGYYYYDGVLSPEETIKLFDTIKIPENIHDITRDKKIRLTITVEAVQEKNFVPDYTQDDPWMGIVPIQIINSKYELDITSTAYIMAEFENGAGEDISISTDFFNNVKNIMPGDVYRGVVDIKNTDEKENKYYLELKTIGDDQYDLLKEIKLTVTNINGQVLYDGPIVKENKIFIGQYASGQEDKIDFKIDVPTSLENEYGYLDSKLDFVFSAEHGKEKKVKELSKVNPKTDDKINVAITIFLISSVGLIIVMLIDHRGKRNID